jgi:V8-like Glu-specific endopeptidase
VTAGSFERASRQLTSMVVADGLNLGDVEASLTAAMNRKGSRVTKAMKIVALEAAERVMTNKPLTAKHKAVVEGIVIGNGLRPAIDIEKDTFDPLPAIWEDINGARSNMTPLIRSVGRINVSGHPKISFAGTAFVCGRDLLLTNRHVAEIFMSAANASPVLSFKLGMSAEVDTKEEVDSADTRVLKCTGEGAVSNEWDVAILRVEGLPAEIAPVPLIAVAPNNISGRTAATIGYPGFDEAENLIEQMLIFRSVFNKKRLLPGKFIDTFTVQSYGHDVKALAHDCTTLGGSSGSIVIDVATLKVLGVHFGGESGVRNYSVPTWKLSEIPAFTKFKNQMSFD